jgi:hypothetical protein
MKKILFLTTAVLVTIYFVSCKDNTVIDGLRIAQPPFSGKIENWRLGSGKKLLAIAQRRDSAVRSLVLDSCTIDSLGNFKLNLPTPADSMLMLYGIIGVMCTKHSIINPVGLRYCSTDFLVKGSSGSYLGSIFRASDSSQVTYTGKVLANLYYFNSGGSITGTDTCTYELSSVIEHNEVTQTKGWNSLFIVYDSVYGVNSKVRITTDAQTVKWYFSAIHDKSEKHSEFFQRKYLMKGK